MLLATGKDETRPPSKSGGRAGGEAFPHTWTTKALPWFRRKRVMTEGRAPIIRNMRNSGPRTALPRLAPIAVFIATLGEHREIELSERI